MKKIFLLIILSLNLSLVNALSLNKIDNNLKAKEQVISFAFDAQSAMPRVFAAGNDLIVDFFSITNATNQSQFAFSSGYIRQVEIVSVGTRTRVLLIGGANYKYQIAQNNQTIDFVFSDQTASSSITKENIGVVGLSQTNKANSGVLQISDIKFTRDDNGGGVIEIPYTGDSQIKVKDERAGEKLLLSLNAVAYPQKLIKRIDTTDFDTPIKYIDSSGGNNQLKISIINRGSWDYALYQLQGKLIINVRNLSQSENSSSHIPNLNSQSKSDRISFNFQNIDVRALLQLLADFSGYNILVSDGVSGTMSLKLDNVPWDQALQIILNSKGLGMKRDGNVIRIAPASEMSALSKIQQDSDRAQEAVEPIDSATIRLKYAQATTVQTMLQQQGGAAATAPVLPSPSAANAAGAAAAAAPASLTMGGSGSLLSPRGSILVDTRTNTLIINDTPSRLRDMRDLISKLDIPVTQVLIEARIVEANSNFERDLGTRLLLAGVGGSLTYSNTLENGVTINQTGINAVSADPKSFVNSDMGVATTGSMSAIFAPNSNTLIGLEVDALELQSEGRTISSPKVMTSNYQAANIQQGVQIPYQQASSAGNTNVAFINATLSLQVTPQITDDGYISLNVNIQKNTPSSLSVQGTPAIDTNSVTTQIRVKDGSTILVGGIYVDDQQQVQQQIPGLGDIPYLGWLFKNQVTKNNKKELLIFITPRIIANSLENDN
ncbi:MAG: type pilus assembly protein PilQ [Pseudomonadota bacterium]|jgi:type IV pilus assembly protein PilQ|nr:type pilus assembly protein PilQ [Pseudomonadota bacterium]